MTMYQIRRLLLAVGELLVALLIRR